MDKLRRTFTESCDENTSLLRPVTEQTNTSATGSLAEIHDEDDDKEELPYCADMSWKNRLQYFGVLLGLGAFSAVIGCIFIVSPTIFGVLYTLGNICGLASIFFLVGPQSQLRKIAEPSRAVAVILVLVFITLTLCAAIWWQMAILTVVFCLMQFLALCWYGMSYIPYARDAVKRCCRCV